MTASNQNGTIFRGDSVAITFTVANVSAGDLAAATVQWAAALSERSETPLLQKATGQGISVSGLVIEVRLAVADTAALPLGLFLHQCRVRFADGKVSTIAEGRINVKPSLPKPTLIPG